MSSAGVLGRLDDAALVAPSSHVEAALALLLELRRHDPDGALDQRAAKDLAASVATRLLDDADRWSAVLGPCFDVDGVREVLGTPGHPISKQAVSQRAGLLALVTGSGRLVYPAFQFDGGRVVEGLAEVLRELPTELVSRWTVAAWLASPDPVLGGRVIDELRLGRVGAVRESARQWAAALAA